MSLTFNYKVGSGTAHFTSFYPGKTGVKYTVGDVISNVSKNTQYAIDFSLFDSDIKNVFLFFVLKQITDLLFFGFGITNELGIIR